RAGPPRAFRQVLLRGCRFRLEITLGIVDEFLAATCAAEVVIGAGVRVVMGRALRIDSHAAHRVFHVAGWWSGFVVMSMIVSAVAVRCVVLRAVHGPSPGKCIRDDYTPGKLMPRQWNAIRSRK